MNYGFQSYLILLGAYEHIERSEVKKVPRVKVVAIPPCLLTANNELFLSFCFLLLLIDNQVSVSNYNYSKGAFLSQVIIKRKSHLLLLEQLS